MGNSECVDTTVPSCPLVMVLELRNLPTVDLLSTVTLLTDWAGVLPLKLM